MGETFWQRHQPPQWGFLENYPFAALIEAGVGWRVLEVSAPRIRPHQVEPIHVVRMEDNFERLLTFDVTATSHRMRDHATFTRSLEEPVLLASTSRAAAALGTSDPDADFTALLSLPDVCLVLRSCRAGTPPPTGPPQPAPPQAPTPHAHR